MLREIMISDRTLQAFLDDADATELYRGESDHNRGGLHFTPDKSWAHRFGPTLLSGYLPACPRLHVLTDGDFADGLLKGIGDERAFFDFIFETTAADAIVGHDQRNSSVLDVIIHAKHLWLFTPAARRT